jgi:DNA-binding transcriptional regulator/RsmH inhibitor MraZ
MPGDRLFSGSALGAVDASGRVRLPDFVQEAVIGRSGDRRIVFGAHPSDTCMTGFDPFYAGILHAELERRRLADEALGAAADAHHDRARRAFGLAEEGRFDGDGTIALPELLRRSSRIGDLALFVGTGGAFEIWDPSLARERGGELRALAEYRLGANGT